MSSKSPKAANFDCHILPLLPPITPNVKLPARATRLKFGIPLRPPSNITSKSGKNGNVDHSSQLSSPLPPPRSLSSVNLLILRSSVLVLVLSPLCPLRPPRFNLLSSPPLTSVILRVLCGRSRPFPCGQASPLSTAYPPAPRKVVDKGLTCGIGGPYTSDVGQSGAKWGDRPHVRR